MKLTYSNWHKELVHDDAIQSELSTMTKGELEFNNRPFVKHRTDNRDERDDYGSGRAGYRKNFGGRSNAGGSRDNRGGGGGRDSRGGGRGGADNNRNNNNRNFKKRY